MMHSTPDIDRHVQLLTTEQFAAIVQVHTLTVRRWIHAGQVRAGKIGSHGWRIPMTEVDRLLQRAQLTGNGSSTVQHQAAETLCAG